MVSETETFGQKMARLRREKGEVQTASVVEKPLPRTVSAEQQFILENQGEQRTSEPFANEGGGGTIYHNTPGRVQMWKPSSDGKTFWPRTVSNNSIGLLLGNGWRTTCPDCGTNHEGSPYPPGDPNACGAREPIAWTRCPVGTCGKRLFDNLGRADVIDVMHNDVDGEAFIPLEGTDLSTPQDRLQHVFLMHMWHRHPREAEMRNLKRLTADLAPTGRPL